MTLSVCVWCADIYIFENNSFNKKGFCSEECHVAYIETLRRSIKRVETTPESKICVSCYSLFYGDEVFCSPTCKGKYCESQGCFQQKIKFYLKCGCCREFYEVQFSQKRLQRKLKSKYNFCGKKCQHDFYSGENHPLYIKDKHRHYCSKWNEDLRTRVRAFFHDTCFMCGKSGEELGEMLCVHHVNYDKRVCCNDKKPLFVPLCRTCHAKTTGKRKKWENYFEKKLKEVYNYKCFYSKAEYREMKSGKNNRSLGEFEDFLIS